MTPRIPAIIERFRALLHLDDSPRRIALALAVGVFISCTPFYGVQTLLSIALAAVLRLNKAATVAGAWLNLPWFAPFIYSAALNIGSRLAPDLRGLHGVSVALLIGTTVVGLVAAAATFLIALGVISLRRARAPGDGRQSRSHAA